MTKKSIIRFFRGFVLLLLTIFISLRLSAGSNKQKKIDSLEAELKKPQNDTMVLKINGQLITLISDVNKKLDINSTSKAIIEKLLSGKNLEKGLQQRLKKRYCAVLSNRAKYFRTLNNLSEAIKMQSQCLQQQLKINDIAGIGYSYAILGSDYNDIGDIPSALDNLYKGIKYSEQVQDYENLTTCYDALQGIYTDQKDFKQALVCIMKTLYYAKKSGSASDLATIYINTASNYFELKDTTKAIQYCDSAKSIYDELKDTLGFAKINLTLGEIYFKSGKTRQAAGYFTKSLLVCEKYQDLFGINFNNYYLGKYCLSENNISQALHYGEKALKTAYALQEIIQIRDATELMSDIYYKNHNYDKAYDMYKVFTAMKDSVNNDANHRKTLSKQFQFEYEKRSVADSIKAANEKLVINAQLASQKNQRNSLVAVLVVIIIFLIFGFNRYQITQKQKKIIAREKQKSEELLLNILPEEVAEELKEKGSSDAKLMDEVTVLFTDFKGFTQLSEKLSPTELVAEINECFSAFDHIMAKYNIEKIKTIGDSYMAAGGLPTPNKTHPDDVVNAALEIQEYMQRHRAERESKGKLFFEIRIGIHTGPVVAGIVGVKKFQYDIWGDTVNTASRMESSGEVGKVNISGTTYELVKDKFTCTHRGKIQAKGKGEVDMYFVEG